MGAARWREGIVRRVPLFPASRRFDLRPVAQSFTRSSFINGHLMSGFWTINHQNKLASDNQGHEQLPEHGAIYFAIGIR